MTNLLKIEWLKINKYRTFWILSGLLLTLLALASYFTISGIMKTGGNGVNVLGADNSFSNVWNKVSYMTKVFSGLLSVIIIILTTNEYQFKTNRQNVIDGWKRIDFFNAKWLLVVVLSAAVTLFAILQGLFFGLTGGSSFSNIGDNFINILYVFILTLNYFSLALTISFFLKRSGMSIVIFLLYAYMIELLINQFFTAKLHTDFASYLPMESSANLIPMSKMESMSAMMLSSGPSANVLMAASLVWIAIYYFVGRARLLKTDW